MGWSAYVGVAVAQQLSHSAVFGSQRACHGGVCTNQERGCNWPPSTWYISALSLGSVSHLILFCFFLSRSCCPRPYPGILTACLPCPTLLFFLSIVELLCEACNNRQQVYLCLSLPEPGSSSSSCRHTCTMMAGSKLN